MTVGQSPARESHTEQSEAETRKTAFCSSETLKSYAGGWTTVTGCPVSNPGKNCANGLFGQWHHVACQNTSKPFLDQTLCKHLDVLGGSLNNTRGVMQRVSCLLRCLSPLIISTKGRIWPCWYDAHNRGSSLSTARSTLGSLIDAAVSIQEQLMCNLSLEKLRLWLQCGYYTQFCGMSVFFFLTSITGRPAQTSRLDYTYPLVLGNIVHSPTSCIFF